MGGVPSREAPPHIRSLRYGAHEIGLIPLTRQFFNAENPELCQQYVRVRNDPNVRYSYMRASGYRMDELPPAVYSLQDLEKLVDVIEESLFDTDEEFLSAGSAPITPFTVSQMHRILQREGLVDMYDPSLEGHETEHGPNKAPGDDYDSGEKSSNSSNSSFFDIGLAQQQQQQQQRQERHLQSCTSPNFPSSAMPTQEDSRLASRDTRDQDEETVTGTATSPKDLESPVTIATMHTTGSEGERNDSDSAVASPDHRLPLILATNVDARATGDSSLQTVASASASAAAAATAASLSVLGVSGRTSAMPAFSGKTVERVEEEFLELKAELQAYHRRIEQQSAAAAHEEHVLLDMAHDFYKSDVHRRFKRAVRPVPCAVVFIYVNNFQEHDSFAFLGHRVNVIGCFGMRTYESHQDDALPILHARKGIVKAAGDRTLERVLALAAKTYVDGFFEIVSRELQRRPASMLLRGVGDAARKLLTEVPPSQLQQQPHHQHLSPMATPGHFTSELLYEPVSVAKALFFDRVSKFPLLCAGLFNNYPTMKFILDFAALAVSVDEAREGPKEQIRLCTYHKGKDERGLAFIFPGELLAHTWLWSATQTQSPVIMDGLIQYSVSELAQSRECRVQRWLETSVHAKTLLGNAAVTRKFLRHLDNLHSEIVRARTTSVNDNSSWAAVVEFSYDLKLYRIFLSPICGPILTTIKANKEKNVKSCPHKKGGTGQHGSRTNLSRGGTGDNNSRTINSAPTTQSSRLERENSNSLLGSTPNQSLCSGPNHASHNRIGGLAQSALFAAPATSSISGGAVPTVARTSGMLPAGAVSYATMSGGMLVSRPDAVMSFHPGTCATAAPKPPTCGPPTGLHAAIPGMALYAVAAPPLAQQSPQHSTIGPVYAATAGGASAWAMPAYVKAQPLDRTGTAIYPAQQQQQQQQHAHAYSSVAGATTYVLHTNENGTQTLVPVTFATSPQYHHQHAHSLSGTGSENTSHPSAPTLHGPFAVSRFAPATEVASATGSSSAAMPSYGVMPAGYPAVVPFTHDISAPSHAPVHHPPHRLASHQPPHIDYALANATRENVFYTSAASAAAAHSNAQAGSFPFASNMPAFYQGQPQQQPQHASLFHSVHSQPILYTTGTPQQYSYNVPATAVCGSSASPPLVPSYVVGHGFHSENLISSVNVQPQPPQQQQQAPLQPSAPYFSMESMMEPDQVSPP